MNELDRIAFQIITFGDKAKEMLDMPCFNQYCSLEDCSEMDLVLVVTDDAADYEAEITQALSVVKNDRQSYLVLDMNAENDADKYRSLWQHYNKVEEIQTVNDMAHMMIEHLVLPNSFYPTMKTSELLNICSLGEYVGSIYIEDGLDGLNEIDVPTLTKGVAAGVGMSYAHYYTMEEMAPLGDFFHKLGTDVTTSWAIAFTAYNEVMIVYSYDKQD